MKIRNLFLLMVIFFSFQDISASVIDSLKHELLTIDEKDKAHIYNEIYLAGYNTIGRDTLLSYLKQGLELSKKYSDDSLTAYLYSNLGFYYAYSLNEYSKSIDHYEKSEAIYEEMGKSDKLVSIYFKIGEIYRYKSDFMQSIKYLLKAKELSEKKNINSTNFEIYGSLGALYRNLGNYKEAHKYIDKSIEFEKNKEDGNEGKVMNSLYIKSLIYSDEKKDSLALSILKKVLIYYENHDTDQRILNQVTIQIGIIMGYMSKPNEALKYFFRAYDVANSLNDSYLLSTININIGNQYGALDKYNKAIEYFRKGLKIAKDNNFIEMQRDAYFNLAEAYKNNNEYKSALKSFENYAVFDDSLKKVESNQQIVELEKKYETEKKEKQIEVLNRENEIKDLKLRKSRIGLYSAIGFALLGLIVSFVFFRLLSQRQKARELIQKQQSELKFTENLRNYYKLANMLPMIVFFLDKNKNLQYINDAGLKILNVTKEEFNNGIDIYNLFSQKNKEEFENDINQAFKNKTVSEKQYLFKLKNNNKLHVLEYLSPNIENNEVTGILGVMINITEIKALERKVISTVIETENKERKRFSEDLHDGLGPLLSSIKLYISGLPLVDENEKAEMLEYAKELIDESIKSVRNISNNIMPSSLCDKGLVHAIQMFCNKLEYTKAIDIYIKNDTNKIKYNQSIDIILYRVIQELINNTLKHANAKEIKIEFFENNNQLIIKYQDDGIGYDIKDEMETNQGLGLSNIVNRVQSLNGVIKFNKTKQEITEVEITIDI